MSDNKHTPAPWFDDPDRGLIYSRPDPLTRFVIATTESGSDDVQRANAALIVRAVNSHKTMLAALKRIAALDPIVDSKEGFNEWGEADCFEQAQDIARQALFEVEGSK